MTEKLQSKAGDLDKRDDLAHMREKYHLPKTESGKEQIYFCGNSLGLQPKKAKDYILQELEDWKTLGVEGHFHAKNPWMPYHEFLTPKMADVVGAKPKEVVVMNSLTVNLHLLMVSFYRPKGKRSKILIEANAFPSDRYAVESQLRFHGYDPESQLLVLPTSGKKSYTEAEDIISFLEQNGEEIALVLIGGVNYYSGQAFHLKNIVEKGKEMGCTVGFDLAHGAGNIDYNLHQAGPDFAAWCSYKYLNSGPGGLSGIFVHERHAEDFDLPRFAGWWGHDKDSRFKMPDKFTPQAGAEGWQLSNPPILPMASLRASLELFSEVGMPSLRQKSIKLTNFLEECINTLLPNEVQCITPPDAKDRGCQLSLRIHKQGKQVFQQLEKNGIIADWREPDIIRVAPVPMYNTFKEAFEFSERLKEIIKGLD
jgi:kynureninase